MPRAFSMVIAGLVLAVSAGCASDSVNGAEKFPLTASTYADRMRQLDHLLNEMARTAVPSDAHVSAITKRSGACFDAAGAEQSSKRKGGADLTISWDDGPPETQAVFNKIKKFLTEEAHMTAAVPTSFLGGASVGGNFSVETVGISVVGTPEGNIRITAGFGCIPS